MAVSTSASTLSAAISVTVGLATSYTRTRGGQRERSRTGIPLHFFVVKATLEIASSSHWITESVSEFVSETFQYHPWCHNERIQTWETSLSQLYDILALFSILIADLQVRKCMRWHHRHSQRHHHQSLLPGHLPQQQELHLGGHSAATVEVNQGQMPFRCGRKPLTLFHWFRFE